MPWFFSTVSEHWNWMGHGKLANEDQLMTGYLIVILGACRKQDQKKAITLMF